jgi:hypothetical protein
LTKEYGQLLKKLNLPDASLVALAMSAASFFIKPLHSSGI